MFSRGLPSPPRLTKEQTDAQALEAAWSSVGRTARPSYASLSADDAANLDADWRRVGHDRSPRADRPPKDPDAGLSPEERLAKKQAAEHAERQRLALAKATSERIQRELAAEIQANILRRMES